MRRRKRVGRTICMYAWFSVHIPQIQRKERVQTTPVLPVFLKRDMQVTKSKTSWVTEEGKTCKSISMFPDGICCYALLSISFGSRGRRGSSFLRGVNTKLSQQWLGSETVQDISCTPETNRVNIFLGFKGECFYSCPVNWSFIIVTDLCERKATSLPDAYCLIHSNTHLHHAHSHPPQYILTSCLTVWPLTGSTQRARRSKEDSKRLQIKCRRNFIWGFFKDAFSAQQKETKKWSYRHVALSRSDSLFTHNGLGHYDLLLTKIQVI